MANAALSRNMATIGTRCAPFEDPHTPLPSGGRPSPGPLCASSSYRYIELSRSTPDQLAQALGRMGQYALGLPHGTHLRTSPFPALWLHGFHRDPTSGTEGHTGYRHHLHHHRRHLRYLTARLDTPRACHGSLHPAHTSRPPSTPTVHAHRPCRSSNAVHDLPTCTSCEAVRHMELLSATPGRGPCIPPTRHPL